MYDRRVSGRRGGAGPGSPPPGAAAVLLNPSHRRLWCYDQVVFDCSGSGS